MVSQLEKGSFLVKIHVHVIFILWKLKAIND